MKAAEAILVLTELAAAALVDPETEEMRRYRDLEGEDKEFYDAAFLAIGALREQEQGRWVDVKEKLPPDSRPVLVANSEGCVYKGYYDHVHNCWRCTKTMRITHWRKMVKGPKQVVH